MKKINNCIIVLISLVFFNACQIPAYKVNERSHHLPVFPKVKKDVQDNSNPYWSGITAYFDKQSYKMNDGTVFDVESPTINASIGTHYRFKENYYLYAMTGAIGYQHDSLFWENSKLSVGLMLGWQKQLGAQIAYSQELGSYKGGTVTSYLAFQRRSQQILVSCKSDASNQCVGADTTRNNALRIMEDLMTSIIGIEVGRLKIGEKGNTTVNFKAEIGYNHIMSRHIDREDFNSDYTHTKGSYMFNLHAGFTLW